jgi:hypothetical protein
MDFLFLPAPKGSGLYAEVSTGHCQDHGWSYQEAVDGLVHVHWSVVQIPLIVSPAPAVMGLDW